MREKVDYYQSSLFSLLGTKKIKMKDCCKTGNEDEQKKNGLKKWFNYGLYAFIGAIIIGVIALQLFGK